MAGLPRLIIFVLSALLSVDGRGDDFKPAPGRPGPWVAASKGEVWPKPAFQQKVEEFFQVDPSVFQFQVRMT